MSTLEKAITIAAKAHYNQKDRYGTPYILHPLRVMFKVNNEVEQIVAILHDVIEKSEITLDDLAREGFSPAVIEAVDSLSKRNGESYLDYIQRAKSMSLSRRVKKADLEDKLDLIKDKNTNKKEAERFKRYIDAYAMLMNEE